MRVEGAGLRTEGSGLRVQGSGFRVQGSGFRVQGAGLRVQGSGCRVEGAGLHHLLEASAFCALRYSTPRSPGWKRALKQRDTCQSKGKRGKLEQGNTGNLVNQRETEGI